MKLLKLTRDDPDSDGEALVQTLIEVENTSSETIDQVRHSTIWFGQSGEPVAQSYGVKEGASLEPGESTRIEQGVWLNSVASAETSGDVSVKSHVRLMKREVISLGRIGLPRENNSSVAKEIEATSVALDDSVSISLYRGQPDDEGTSILEVYVAVSSSSSEFLEGAELNLTLTDTTGIIIDESVDSRSIPSGGICAFEARLLSDDDSKLRGAEIRGSISIFSEIGSDYIEGISRSANESKEFSLGIDSSQTGPYRFYIKSEPSGEVACSKVSNDHAPKVIRDCLEGNLDIDAIHDLARECSVCGLLGIFGSGGETDFATEPSRDYGKAYGLPKDENGDYDPGIYVILSAITKASLEIEIPSLSAQNVEELRLSYNSFDFPVKHPLYGKLNANVLTGIEFRSETFNPSEIEDRGYDLVTHIVLAYGRKCSLITMFSNDDELENTLAGKRGVRTLIALTDYLLTSFDNTDLITDLYAKILELVDFNEISNKLILSDVERLSIEIERVRTINHKSEIEKTSTGGLKPMEQIPTPTYFVIAINSGGSIFSRVEEVEESGGDGLAMRKAALEASQEIVDDVARQLEGYVDCLAAPPAREMAVTFLPFEEAIKGGALDNDLDDFHLFLRFENVLDSDCINQEFLALEDWGFYAHWVDEQDQVRAQGYDYGEFDTGYFAAIEWGNDENHYLNARWSPTRELREAAIWSDATLIIEKSLDDDVEAVDSASEKFDITLTEVGPKKVDILKMVRAIAGVSLREAKDIIDEVAGGAPTKVIEGLDADDAKRSIAILEKAGGKAKISEAES